MAAAAVRESATRQTSRSVLTGNLSCIIDEQEISESFKRFDRKSGKIDTRLKKRGLAWRVTTRSVRNKVHLGLLEHFSENGDLESIHLGDEPPYSPCWSSVCGCQVWLNGFQDWAKTAQDFLAPKRAEARKNNNNNKYRKQKKRPETRMMAYKTNRGVLSPLQDHNVCRQAAAVAKRDDRKRVDINGKKKQGPIPCCV